jgi:hypothetical protein
MAENKKIRVEFSKTLKDLLLKLEKQGSYVAFELMWMTEPDADYFNGLKIKKVDVSKVDWCFNVTLENGSKNDMKIGKFIRYFFQNVINEYEITKFSKLYNAAKDNKPHEDGTPIKKKEYSYDPKDVESTFLSLVSKTYPHGHEEEVLEFLPELNKDSVGNYYTIIGGNPETMFTSHLDTADRNQRETFLFKIKEDSDEIIVTDGTSVLGADDKSGVTIMLYMMSHNVPGLYYFFIGEERGGIGSHALADIYEEVEYLREIKRCVSFDRRNYHSIITSQMGTDCCSPEFAQALCDAYNDNGLSMKPDNTGIYTDSASFIDLIPECTNVSVGYFNEHTGKEKQNISFLKRLCEASIKIDWKSLPTERSLEDLISKRNMEKAAKEKHKDLLDKLNQATPYLDRFVSMESGKTYVCFDLEGVDIATIHESLINISEVLKQNQPQKRSTIDSTIVEFDETYIKIRID